MLAISPLGITGLVALAAAMIVALILAYAPHWTRPPITQEADGMPIGTLTLLALAVVMMVVAQTS